MKTVNREILDGFKKPCWLLSSYSDCKCKRAELLTSQDLLWWGGRAWAPTSLWSSFLREISQGFLKSHRVGLQHKKLCWKMRLRSAPVLQL